MTRFLSLLLSPSSRSQALCASTLLAALFASLAPALAADMNKSLHVVFPVAETGFDPVRIDDLYSNTLLQNIFDTLLTFDYLARPAKIIPSLAEDMPTVNGNATEFVFRIRKGVYFTPDPAFKGKKREVTADDFVYSFKRLLDREIRSSSMYLLDGKLVGMEAVLDKAKQTGKLDYDMPVEGLMALDRYTLRIRIKQPDYKLLAMLATVNMAVVAREVVEAAGTEGIMNRPVGTGPYMLKSWVRGSKIVLEANPDYRNEIWHGTPGDDPEDHAIAKAMQGKRMPIIGRVEISIIEEDQPRWVEFLSGRKDYLLVPQAFVPKAFPGNELASNLHKLGIRRQKEVFGNYFTYFNMKDPIVGGYTKERIALRRALILGYNLPEQIHQVEHDQAVIAESPMSPGLAGYDPAFKSGMQYDPALARGLLDRFGYKDRNGDGYRETPDGKPLVIQIAFTPTSLDQARAEVWKKSMDAIGIKVSFQMQRWPDLLKSSELGKLPMWTVGWSAPIPDGDSHLQQFYGPNNAAINSAQFSLAEFDRRYEKARAMPDGPERDQLYREMSRIVINYSAWHLGIYRVDNYLVQPWLVGYKKHPFLSQWKFVDLRRGARAP